MRKPCRVVQGTEGSEHDRLPEAGPPIKAQQQTNKKKKKTLVLFWFCVAILKMPEAGYFIKDNLAGPGGTHL